MHIRNYVTSVMMAALVATNVACMIRVTNLGNALERLGFRYRAEQAGSQAARKLIPALIGAGITKAEILATAVRINPTAQPREGSGATWIDPLGFRFDDAGRLTEVLQVSAGIID